MCAVSLAVRINLRALFIVQQRVPEVAVVVALGAGRLDVFDSEHCEDDDSCCEQHCENDEHGEHSSRGGHEDWIVRAQQCWHAQSKLNALSSISAHHEQDVFVHAIHEQLCNGGRGLRVTHVISGVVSWYRLTWRRRLLSTSNTYSDGTWSTRKYILKAVGDVRWKYKKTPSGSCITFGGKSLWENLNNLNSCPSAMVPFTPLTMGSIAAQC